MSFGGTALSFLLLTALLLPTAHGGPLDAPVITLGEKKSLFGEKAQANEYVSYALYYWPDPANPEGPYKPIDGKKNQRLRSMDDSGKMAAFIGTVCSLGRQYELNRDPRAASRAGEWLRAWFIAPATRMQPHLKYAQIRPGHRTEGDGGGIIDLYRMPDFLDALAALKRSGALTKEEWKRVDAWLNQYYAWLATSRQGRHAHTRSNNHYLFYVAQCAHLAHFLGRDNEARQWLAEAFANMDRHIAPDGSQPEELKRAEPWQYSVYTLQAWGYLVQIAERMGDKNYRYRKTAAGASIQKAADYLLPFRTHPEAWPWKAPGQEPRFPPSLNRPGRIRKNRTALEQRQLLKLPLIHWKTPCSAASRHPERDVFPGNLFSKEHSGGIFPSLRGFPFPRRDGIRLRPKAFLDFLASASREASFRLAEKIFIDPRPSILHQLLIDEHLSIPDFPKIRPYLSCWLYLTVTVSPQISFSRYSLAPSYPFCPLSGVSIPSSRIR